MKQEIAALQRQLGIKDDGILGPITMAAIYERLGIKAAPLWPTQAEIRSGKSLFGKAGDESQLVAISPAYQLKYDGKNVSSIRVHRAIALDVQQVLREVLAHYGLEEIQRLGLDQYGGSYALRKVTKGTQMSMHSWGIALDWAPSSNDYYTRAPRATLSHSDCNAWWDIWEAHGAVSLGRRSDYDWMHVQFALI